MQKNANANPQDTVSQFIDAMNNNDLEAALGLYEPGASLVVQPGIVVTGSLPIREALAGFLTLKPTMTTESYEIIESDDIALYCSHWNLVGTDVAGNQVQMGGRSSDVLRRQPAGQWLIALDNPWGTAILS